MPASAQNWPTRPVRIIIPLGPGGGGDVFTRLMAEELQKHFGQPFVVENRPGGGLNIGTRACAEAAPDGYTFCVLSGEPVVYNQFTFKNLPYNPEKDLTPVVNLFINANALVVNSSLGVKTIPDLVAHAKARPGTLSYGTFSFMLAYFMDQLNKKNGIDIVRVPFRSGNEMVNAVMANTTPIVFLGLSNMIGPVKSGQFTGLALNSDARLPLFPGHSDLARGDRRGLSAAVVRPVRAGGHAGGHRRRGARRGGADRQRAGLAAAQLRRARGRARDRPARRVHQVHRQQPRVCREGGQGGRHQAGMT